MNTLKNSWKVFLAVLLFLGAVVVFVLEYPAAKREYAQERSALQEQICALQLQIEENRKYESVQAQLENATREVEESRARLYRKFPVELKEEDQILYMLYLEKLFGEEVEFRFAEELPIAELSDGARLQGVTVRFDFSATYEGFKNMVRELAADDVVTSVRYAELEYDTRDDRLAGQLVITRYVLADGREYQAPAVNRPAVGKENIYEK